VSLSQEPVFSLLQRDFVVGVKDITNEPYAGTSGSHGIDQKVAKTTNGAGPHNIQMFMIAPDGTVLHALTGYWEPHDLAREILFAEQLNAIWSDKAIGVDAKKAKFRKLQIAHIHEHPAGEAKRSRMQTFDAAYEAKHRLNTSDTIRDASLINPQGHINMEAFKTCDEIVHERMAQRPFVPFDRFDIAAFVDYGRPRYDKDENMRDTSGKKITSAFQYESVLPRKVNRQTMIQSYKW
jgi:hypothetical protein